MSNAETKVSAKQAYEKLKTKRSTYIDRGVKCAKVTIPHLFPEESANEGTKFSTPYQSIGARGVNNLASKLILALFPPNEHFFRLGLTPELKAQLGDNMDKVAEIDQRLMQIETQIINYIEENQVRVTVQEAIKQLIIAGNALIFLPPDKDGAKLYDLKNYTVKRDGLGTVHTIVTQDKLIKSTLPEDVQSLVQDFKEDAEVTIYTHVQLVGENYEAFQEIDGKIIPQSEQTYPKDKSPYIPLRMTKQDGEDYGRSFVEEYLGDLTSLEKLSKALVIMASISARVLYLVNPNGVTRPKNLQNAEDGEFVSGRKDDVTALQLDKYPDLQVTKTTCDTIEQRLSFAFLLSSVVQRNADRVTAEEIRTVASELEDTLGGVYSILSQELQLPLVRRLMTKLMQLGTVAQLPDGFVEPTITTGMEALGRGHDFNKFTTFMGIVGQLPDAMQYMKIGSWVTAIATSLGIDTTGMIKTEEEIQQEMQQAQEQQMIAQMAVKGMGNNGNPSEL